MEFISVYVPLVQFAGAFNFAFSTQLFHEHFSKHFINIPLKQRADFNIIKTKITADVTTLNSYSPITTSDGKTNQHELDEVKKDYNEAYNKIDATNNKLATSINNQKAPYFSRQLFMLIGLYSLFSILFICKIGHTSAHKVDTAIWCNGLCMLNIITIIWWFYFLISETIWLCGKSEKPKYKLLSPSFSWTMLFYIAAVGCIFVWRHNIPEIAMPDHYKIYLTLSLPLLGYLSSIMLFYISNIKSICVITWWKNIYRLRLWRITKKKKKILSPYNHLKKPSFTIS